VGIAPFLRGPAPRRVPHVLALALGLGLCLGLVTTGSADPAACPNTGLPGTPYEGFGADTPGGAGKTVYRVTTLADSGPGSLRDALAAGHRCIVFAVTGDIVLKRQLYVRGAFVTIDGFSAPAPGVTLRDYGLSVWGSHGAHDVIVRGLRFRNAGQKTCAAGECWDGLQIKSGAYRVVIDHVSSDRASDGALDICDSSDVTVQWSLLSGTRNQSLIDRAVRVSLHHNLFVSGDNRNPQVQWDDTLATAPSDTVLDFRNNVVWDFAGYGAIVRARATVNVTDNYFYSSSRPSAAQALIVDRQGRAHAAGNHSGNGADIDARGTDAREFRAAAVGITDACRAAYEVQDEAGARGVAFGPDAVDERYLGRMPATQLPGCLAALPAPASPAPSSPTSGPAPSAPSTTPGSKPDLVTTSLVMPSTVHPGVGFPIQFGLTNRGTAPGAGSRVRIYLSTDDKYSAGDVLLRERSVAPLAPGKSQWHGITEVVPANVTPGSYHVLLVADADGVVGEGNERNNVTTAAVAVVRPTPSAPTPDLVTGGVSMPTALRRGGAFHVAFTVANRGTGTSAGSRVKIYLSTKPGGSAGDVLLRSRAVSALAAGASEPHALTEVIPPDIKPGSYYVLLVVDPGAAVSELNERNNVTATAVTVR